MQGEKKTLNFKIYIFNFLKHFIFNLIYSYLQQGKRIKSIELIYHCFFFVFFLGIRILFFIKKNTWFSGFFCSRTFFLHCDTWVFLRLYLSFSYVFLYFLMIHDLCVWQHIWCLISETNQLRIAKKRKGKNSHE